MIPMSDIGSSIKTVKGIPPQASAAATINGAAINRDGYMSCSLHHGVGATTGAPTSFTADAKLQHSDDGSTNWTDFLPAGAGSSSAAQLTAINTEAEKDVDLTGAKKFIRQVETVAFVGGSTPTVGVSGTVVLGGAVKIPAT